jgi:hypothetical protein
MLGACTLRPGQGGQLSVPSSLEWIPCLKRSIPCQGWLVFRGCVVQKIAPGCLSAEHRLPNPLTWDTQGRDDHGTPSGQPSLCAQLQHLNPRPPHLSAPQPSWAAPQKAPSPLLQGEIGRHPFSSLGTRNPCVSFPVKGLPFPRVTLKSTVWLQPVTASTGSVCARVHASVCTGVWACARVRIVRAHLHLGMRNAGASGPHKDLNSNHGVPLTPSKTLSTSLDLCEPQSFTSAKWDEIMSVLPTPGAVTEDQGTVRRAFGQTSLAL